MNFYLVALLTVLFIRSWSILVCSWSDFMILFRNFFKLSLYFFRIYNSSIPLLTFFRIYHSPTSLFRFNWFLTLLSLLILKYFPTSRSSIHIMNTSLPCIRWMQTNLHSFINHSKIVISSRFFFFIIVFPCL